MLKNTREPSSISASKHIGILEKMPVCSRLEETLFRAKRFSFAEKSSAQIEEKKHFPFLLREKAFFCSRSFFRTTREKLACATLLFWKGAA